jgi:hypothetical protein
MSFPSNPINNQRVTVNNINYTYSSANGAWSVTLNATAGASLAVNTISVTNTISVLSSTPSINSTTGALVVTGGVGIGGNIQVAGNVSVLGNLSVLGNTLTIGTDNLAVADSIIDLHTPVNLAPLTVNDGRDIGIRFHYYKTSDRHTFLGWKNTTETLTYFQDAEEASGVVTGTLGNVDLGSLYLGNATTAASTTTGALVIRGGAGIGGNAYIGGTVGIATTSSTYQFQVGSATSDTRSVFWPNTAFAVGVGNGATGFAGWIGGSGVADNMVFSSSGGSEFVRINNSGNVGIGTGSPGTKLSVAGAVSFIGNVSAPAVDAAVYRPADGTLGFVSNGLERMRIHSGGSISIGSSNLGSKLHVYETNSADCNIGFEATTAGYAVNLTLWGQNAAGSRFNNISSKFGSTEQWYIGGNGSDSTIAFRTATTERMRIDSAGNVGIGSSITNRLSITYDGTSGAATIGPNSTGGSTSLALGTSLSGTYAERLQISSAGAVTIAGNINAGSAIFTPTPPAFTNNTAVATTAFVRRDGGFGNMQVFTTAIATNPVWTVPAGVTKVKATVIGGGGAGGGGAATIGVAGAGGGGGSVGVYYFTGLTPGGNVTYNVGNGATGVSGAIGPNGGQSNVTVGTLTINAPGGSGGTLGAAASTPYVGGLGGTIATQTNGTAVSFYGEAGQPGGNSVGTAAAGTCIGGMGGTGHQGKGGGRGAVGATVATAGGVGTGAGGGGSASTTAAATTGAAGGSGAVIFEF